MVLRLISHLGEESKVISPGFKTTKPLKSKTRPKSKEKEKGQNSGCYKPTPLKEISSSRFGCSGIKHEFSHLRKPFPTRVSFLPLYNVPTEFHMSDCLASGWFASLDPFLANLTSYVTLTPILLCLLSCLGQGIIWTELCALL